MKVSYYNKLLDDVIKEAVSLNIPVSSTINSSILINTRCTRRFGQCKRIKSKIYSFQIELSFFLLDADEKYIKQTLAHEVLHTCPNCFNHGTEWKSYANKMNRAYGYEIARTNNCNNMGITSPIKRNYVIKCKSCGNEIVRQRASNLVKDTNRYMCKCGGELYLL